MKRELGIARCGLACCLCSENAHCRGCDSGDCPGFSWCENRKCSAEKGLKHCYECGEDCRKQLLGKSNPMALHSLPGYTAKKNCWTVWNGTKRTAWFITGRESRVIMTTLRIRRN